MSFSGSWTLAGGDDRTAGATRQQSQHQPPQQTLRERHPTRRDRGEHRCADVLVDEFCGILHCGENSGGPRPDASEASGTGVNDIPQHTRLMIERLLDAYCARICPPLARNTVMIGYRIDDTQVVVHQLKRILGVAGTREPVPVARFRYRAAGNDWALEYFESRGWRRHHPLASSRSFLELLREFDRDPAGLFWSRLDGKSLRWCSSRGRCDGCELRYQEILGLDAHADRATTDAAVDARIAALSGPSTRR